MKRLLMLLATTCLAGTMHAQWRQVDPPAGGESALPMLAASARGEVFLSWVDPAAERTHALRFAKWDGKGWTAAETIAQGANWFVNWADFPAVSPLADGSMLAHWLVKAPGAGTYGYGIRVARQDAGAGGAWRETVALNENDTSDYAGFVSFAGANAAYLSPPQVRPEGEGHIKTLRFIRFGSDGRAESDREIDADVCSCCQTATVQTSYGLVVAYRDHLPGEIRDISVVRFREGEWSAPERLHADGWRINGCPTEGPSMAVAGKDLAIGWMTRTEEQPRLQLALSADEGLRFGAPVRVDDGNPLGRPSVIAAPGGFVVVWLEKTADAAEVRIRRVSAAGGLGASRVVAGVAAARSTGLPRVAMHGEQVMVAWRDGRVRAAWTQLNELPEAVSTGREKTRREAQ